MASLALLQLELPGWEKTWESSLQHQMIYENKLDFLSLSFLNGPPDIPVSINQPGKLVDHCRKITTWQKGALILVKVDVLQEVPFLETIYKLPLENQGPDYYGCLRFLFQDFSFEILLKSLSQEGWEQRERCIKKQLMEQSGHKARKRLMEHWSHDPYDLHITQGFLFNHSEREAFDKAFPEHALSRLRLHLQMLKKHLWLAPQLSEYPIFSGDYQQDSSRQ
ncbi:hypothetical protein AAG747_01030 [Rapidithrix thailandica]|uniref:Uncharacterized protein n=1 Tax=Rapidithrix thailandica TaxID=413964 RepID=A0AAW9S279_9BACT